MKKIKNDNLFDTKITALDLVKVALLIVSFFSTWRIMDLITPDETFAFIRIAAAVAVVEGAFVAFERATKDAKTEKQSKLATVGFFCSLTVITTYLALSGFLEAGGPALLSTQLGKWAGITWTVQELVMISALAVTAAWVAGLASIARLFALADPDKQAELQKNQLDGDVKTEANQALKQALRIAMPEISIQRALLSITDEYSEDLTPAQLTALLIATESHLRQHYAKSTTAPAATPQVIDAVAKRRGNKLAGMLFKRPVTVRPLQASTAGPGELVEVATNAGPKDAAAPFVESMTTAPASPAGDADRRPKGPKAQS